MLSKKFHLHQKNIVKEKIAELRCAIQNRIDPNDPRNSEEINKEIETKLEEQVSNYVKRINERRILPSEIKDYIIYDPSPPFLDSHKSKHLMLKFKDSKDLGGDPEKPKLYSILVESPVVVSYKGVCKTLKDKDDPDSGYNYSIPIWIEMDNQEHLDFLDGIVNIDDTISRKLPTSVIMGLEGGYKKGFKPLDRDHFFIANDPKTSSGIYFPTIKKVLEEEEKAEPSQEEPTPAKGKRKRKTEKKEEEKEVQIIVTADKTKNPCWYVKLADYTTVPMKGDLEKEIAAIPIDGSDEAPKKKIEKKDRSFLNSKFVVPLPGGQKVLFTKEGTARHGYKDTWETLMNKKLTLIMVIRYDKVFVKAKEVHIMSRLYQATILKQEEIEHEDIQSDIFDEYSGCFDPGLVSLIGFGNIAPPTPLALPAPTEVTDTFESPLKRVKLLTTKVLDHLNAIKGTEDEFYATFDNITIELKEDVKDVERAIQYLMNEGMVFYIGDSASYHSS